jgi:hypothetical protein
MDEDLGVVSRVARESYAGIGDDGSGIYLHPAEWNCARLADSEETLLVHLFKLIYMERVRQIKRWGDQRHPDGTGEGYAELAAYLKTRCQDNAARGKVTWLDILMEEIGEVAECPPVVSVEDLSPPVERDLESEMVQSAAVIAAWYSDICRRELTSRVEFAEKTISQAPLITREKLERDISLHDGGASAYGLGLLDAQPDGRGETWTFDRGGLMVHTQWGLTGQQGVERLRDAIRRLQEEHGGQLPEGEYTIDLRGRDDDETPE